MPSVRTLADSKLGIISIGDRPPWNSIGLPSSKLLLKCCRKYSSIHDEKWMITRLLLLTTPNTTLSSNLQPAHLGWPVAYLFPNPILT
ncbi:hypothetical protein B296_00028588 [Ensete ventricosum]|uniref:Uncharacterized protein n=1 Tax=Ensete ventricosum TaxID=4639 RepID=A0A426XGS3_ENSVE|nr:hypothetical protein B296_00028588 [Ensete ventricosum]